MLLERAELTIRAGSEEAFDAAMREKGIAILQGVPGVRSVQMGRGVENPGKFMLLVEWDSLEIHNQFRDRPVYPEFVGIFANYSEGGTMEHFQMG